MCPYYQENYGGYCAIYKTTQNSHNDSYYCHGCGGYWRECPNYKQLCSMYNGNPPPPSHYK